MSYCLEPLCRIYFYLHIEVLDLLAGMFLKILYQTENTLIYVYQCIVSMSDNVLSFDYICINISISQREITEVKMRLRFNKEIIAI